MTARPDEHSPRAPLIGITIDSGDATHYELPTAYVKAVQKAGGLPVVIPYHLDESRFGQLLDELDGIVFSGGNDLDPALFGQTRHPKASPVDPDRQRFELLLLAEVEKRRMPVLGICLGSQLMNVHRGGSLIQFLPEEARESPIEHRKLATDEVRHPINLRAESLLGRHLGKTQILGNSSHKQAVARLGRGLRIIATSPDGIIEGVEDPSMAFFVGVQWHPERLYEEEDHLKIFRLLVKHASLRVKS